MSKKVEKSVLDDAPSMTPEQLSGVIERTEQDYIAMRDDVIGVIGKLDRQAFNAAADVYGPTWVLMAIHQALMGNQSPDGREFPSVLNPIFTRYDLTPRDVQLAFAKCLPAALVSWAATKGKSGDKGGNPNDLKRILKTAIMKMLEDHGLLNRRPTGSQAIDGLCD